MSGRIGVGAFNSWEEDSIKEIVIPKTVEKIDFHAFGDCKDLELITIEDPNTKFDALAFHGCPNVRRITCGGKSVLIDNSKNKSKDLTNTVLDIVASVRKNAKDI